MKYLGKYRVKNIEDGNHVLAKLYQYPEAIRADYRYNGMSYNVDVPMKELIELGIVECGCDCVLPILGFENSIIGEVCQVCGKEYLDYRGRSSEAFKTDSENDNQYLKDSYKNLL